MRLEAEFRTGWVSLRLLLGQTDSHTRECCLLDSVEHVEAAEGFVLDDELTQRAIDAGCIREQRRNGSTIRGDWPEASSLEHSGRL